MRELCVAEDGDEVATTTATDLPPPPPRPPAAPVSVSIPALVAERVATGRFFWSVELLPGTSPHLQSLLQQSLRQLARHRPRPTFVSVSWHAGHLKRAEGGAGIALQHPALDLCKLLQDSYEIPALMHLAAGRMTRAETRAVLEACLAAGVTNILALRGDNDVDAESDFPHASRLVNFIKETFQSKFNVGVAGYPSGHPEAKSLEEDLLHLKAKIDAGADFVLTQLITSIEEFQKFTQKYNKLGIRVPIIPGLFLIQSLNAFEKFIEICKIKVPLNILQDLREFNDKTHEIKYGEHHFQKLLRELMEHSYCPGVHIFCMNRVGPILKFFSEKGHVLATSVEETKSETNILN